MLAYLRCDATSRRPLGAELLPRRARLLEKGAARRGWLPRPARRRSGRGRPSRRRRRQWRPATRRFRAGVAVADGLLAVDLPTGRAWHRYNEDGYGEHADGTPFDGSGIGRAWPLLTGERGHLALAAGEDPLPYLAAMTAMTGPGGMLPEQVWDADPIPPLFLEPGRPTGAAMPLVWAHAEFVKLVNAIRRGRPIEQLAAVVDRYATGSATPLAGGRSARALPVRDPGRHRGRGAVRTLLQRRRLGDDPRRPRLATALRPLRRLLRPAAARNDARIHAEVRRRLGGTQPFHCMDLISGSGAGPGLVGARREVDTKGTDKDQMPRWARGERIRARPRGRLRLARSPGPVSAA